MLDRRGGRKSVVSSLLLLLLLPSRCCAVALPLLRCCCCCSAVAGVFLFVRRYDPVSIDKLPCWASEAWGPWESWAPFLGPLFVGFPLVSSGFPGFPGCPGFPADRVDPVERVSRRISVEIRRISDGFRLDRVDRVARVDSFVIEFLQVSERFIGCPGFPRLPGLPG